MTVRDVVKEAALLAARFALPRLPEGLVRWEDDPAVQPEANLPAVTLTEVSDTPEAPVSRLRELRNDGNLDEHLLQMYAMRVQVQVEAWHTPKGHVLEFAKRMRLGWYTAAVRAVLECTAQPEALRTPVKMIYQAGPLMAARRPVHGHMLPVFIYEIPFRYCDTALDPESVGVIESAELSGTLTDGETELPFTIDTPHPE